MKKLSIVLYLVVFLIYGQNRVLAVDLGKRATTFEIKEEGFVAMMIRKLKTLDLDQENEKMKQLARDRVENPTPVTGLAPATKERSFYFDPTYTLEEDAVLPCGKVLHPAGTTINPLEHMDLNRRLFFIDARNEHQLEWLEGQLTEYLPGQEPILEDRIILVGGSVLKLKKQLNQQEIYFDQSGELTTKFGIKASPAIVEQEGKQLRIREVAVRE
jgi:conjugal transfer pilus assembly protein TraW